MDDNRIFTVALGFEELRIPEDLLTVAKVKELKTRLRKAVADYDKSLDDKQKELNAMAARFVTESDEVKANSSAEEKEAKLNELETKQLAEVEALASTSSESYIMGLVYLSLKELAGLFDQGYKVDENSFKNVPYTKTKLSLAKLFISNEIETGLLFLPPKNLD